MIFEGVPRAHVAHVWLDAWGWLQPAIDRFPNGPSAASLYWSLLSGERQLWIAWDAEKDKLVAAIITEIITYDPSPVKVCRVPWIGGKGMRRWIEPALKMLTAWAIDNGCRFFEGSGRRGWKKFGFEERGLHPETGLPILVRDLAEA